MVQPSKEIYTKMLLIPKNFKLEKYNVTEK